MALNNHPYVDVSNIAIGTHQAEIEELLGMREKTIILNKNERIDYYRYKKGGGPNFIRSALHGSMSIGSAGFWEIIGIPFEAFNQREQYLAIRYDYRNIAIDVQEVNLLQTLNN